MPEEDIKGLGEFFDFLWGDTHGYVYLPVINRGEQLTKFMFEWPRQRAGVIRHVNLHDSLGSDVFSGPSLYKEPKPEKEYVLGTHVLWTDFDGNAPTTLEGWKELAAKHDVPEPSMILGSSVEGRDHAYWRLAHLETDVSKIESRNRAITYTLGADLSGWDANQFLRPPFTHNYGYRTGGDRKPWFNGVPANVVVRRAVAERLNPNIFNPLGTPEHIIASRIELGDIPDLSRVFMDRNWPEDFRTVFNYTRDEAAESSEHGRSGALSRLGFYGAENGFSDEEIYAILDDADSRWEKYTGRRNRDDLLLDIIARARAKHGYLDADDISLAGLVKQTATTVIDSKLVYSFQELMELDVHIDWLLEDLIRNEGVGIITGPPGVGKTQFGINLLAHMALGREFLGWNNPGGPKKGFMFSLEMSTIPIKIFWNKIHSAYNDVMIDLHKNFHVMPLGEGIALDKEPGQKLFEKMLAEYQPDIILVDSLQKVTSKELTDELAVKAMLEFLDRMRIKYHTAMVFIHHNRKKGNDSAGVMTVLDDMYGSRYIAANVDFVLNMRSTVKNVVTVDTMKNRLGEERDSFDITRLETLQFELGTDGTTLEGILNATSTRPESGSSDGKRRNGLFGLD